ncbi:MAG: hypothetical protein KME21_02420 [Desmonostoc vinosum HA7617-LM4]|jgi:hypothetical protein|nr:hypothetical protein [Desmonostoc vinosum HA7617-LM4]
MARTNKIIVRLTDKEKEKLENYAMTLDVSMSEVIQDYIKSLPNMAIPRTSPALSNRRFDLIEDALQGGRYPYLPLEYVEGGNCRESCSKLL